MLTEKERAELLDEVADIQRQLDAMDAEDERDALASRIGAVEDAVAELGARLTAIEAHLAPRRRRTRK